MLLVYGLIMQVEGSIWLYILPFVVPAVTALIMFMRRQGKSDADLGLASYEVKAVQDDVKEIKSDVKELHNKSQDALRQIDILDLRLKNIEEDHKRSKME